MACFWPNYLCLIANKSQNASKFSWPITFVFVLMLKSFIIIKFSYLSEVLLKDIVISSEKESRFTLFWSRFFFIRNFNVSANMFTEFWLLHFEQLQIKPLSTTFIKPGLYFFLSFVAFTSWPCKWGLLVVKLSSSFAWLIKKYWFQFLN